MAQKHFSPASFVEKQGGPTIGAHALGKSERQPGLRGGWGGTLRNELGAFQPLPACSDLIMCGCELGKLGWK